MNQHLEFGCAIEGGFYIIVPLFFFGTSLSSSKYDQPVVKSTEADKDAASLAGLPFRVSGPSCDHATISVLCKRHDMWSMNSERDCHLPSRDATTREDYKLPTKSFVCQRLIIHHAPRQVGTTYSPEHLV